jgi:hypothetical protein
MAEFPSPALRWPGRPSADPWSVVALVMTDLMSHAVKGTFGPEANLGAAATAASALLVALGVEPVVRDG